MQRLVLLLLALVVVASCVRNGPRAKMAVGSAQTNWTLTISGNQSVVAAFDSITDCKTAYAALALNDGCNPATQCVGNDPMLTISGCTINEGSFRALSYVFSLQLATDTSNCYAQSGSSFCAGPNASVALSYSGTSAKQNCVNDFSALVGNSYCTIQANCGASTPSIVSTGQSSQSTYACSISPAIGLNANSVSFTVIPKV